eukprot:snap_masked-scaffold_16-processed-gene-6.89-mRNA-1 protein AED:1.00 eAED:1.00 QI:0/0/0/0/1/1/2/0/65
MGRGYLQSGATAKWENTGPRWSLHTNLSDEEEKIRKIRVRYSGVHTVKEKHMNGKMNQVPNKKLT